MEKVKVIKEKNATFMHSSLSYVVIQIKVLYCKYISDV